jgi:replicative DNA helicase
MIESNAGEFETINQVIEETEELLHWDDINKDDIQISEPKTKQDESILRLINKLTKEQVKNQAEKVETEQLVRLKEIAKVYSGDDRVVSFEEIYNSVKTAPPVDKIYTGWAGLDGLLKGIRPQHLIVWSGITKHGKTSTLMDLTTKIANKNPLWLPIEESAEELMEKFIERGESPPHGFSPRNIGTVDTNWIEQKIVEGIVKYDCKVVIIDNLDWVSPSNGNDSDSKADRIASTVREIKALAKKWNISIFLIVHLTKNSKADTNPTFEDLKGSVAIGQVCDKAILVWRETKRGVNGELEITNNTNVSVNLNRQGKTGNIKMVYEDGHFYEREWKQTGFGDYDAL